MRNRIKFVTAIFAGLVSINAAASEDLDLKIKQSERKIFNLLYEMITKDQPGRQIYICDMHEYIHTLESRGHNLSDDEKKIIFMILSKNADV